MTMPSKAQEIKKRIEQEPEPRRLTDIRIPTPEHREPEPEEDVRPTRPDRFWDK